MMIMFNRKYITDKEASERFCYSISWFQKQRMSGQNPPYIKIGRKKIFYDLEALETWFKKHMQLS